MTESNIGVLVQTCILILSGVVSPEAYNLDTRSPVIHRGGNGTYFGYSVDMHRMAGIDRLLVGAPEDESGELLSGAVYICPVTLHQRPEACRKQSREMAMAGSNVTRQWLGATVRSSGEDGIIMACAPFYKSLAYSSVHPTGKCVLYDGRDVATVAPCVPTSLEEKPFTAGSHCLAGTSADINQKRRYIIGGPGSYGAQGSVIIPDGDGNFTRTEEDVGGKKDGEYQGFSVGFGTFSDNDEQDIIAGIPRGEKLLGSVKIYDASLRLLTEPMTMEIVGTQAGSFFGGSVAASDLNNDGLDDLIVGAPNYWNKDAQQLDVGQVNIIYQTSLGELGTQRVDLTGDVERGRFGFVVTALGDINDDGVNDLAVSAPYDGDGAVYIFNGKSRANLNTEPSQVIRPSDFEVNIPMRRFGFSAAGNQDSDENLYPDLLVGAYESDVAVLIRTKPVIRPHITVSFDSPGVNLTSRTLSMGGQLFSPFYGRTCISYGGLGTNDSYDFDIQLTMDARKLTPRAMFQNNSARILNDDSVTIEKEGGRYCSPFGAFLVNQIIDKVSPIIVEVSVDVVQEEDLLPPGEIAHVLDVYTKVEDSQIPIFVDCINERCAPNLGLSVKSDKSVLYFGDTTDFSLTVVVENVADEAFGALLHVFLPEEARYVSYRQIESDLTIVCKRRTDPAGAMCTIGNPLPRTSRIVLELNFEIASVPGDRTMLHIELKANSTSEEAEDMLADNDVTVSLSLEPEVGIILDGDASIEQVIFNDTAAVLSRKAHEKASEVGDRVVHTYWVRNIGPANIESATLEVSWPMKIEGSDKYLLYLTSASLSNGGKCDIQGGENPEDLQLTDNDEAKRRRRSSDSATSDARSSAQDGDENAVADCSREEGYGGCITITCPLRDLYNDESNTILTVKSRLWIDNLVQGDDPDTWEITSSARLTVNNIPYITQPSKMQQETASLQLTVIPLTSIKAPGVPLWAIVLSIVLGVLLLVIIVLILIKCGFFQRQKLGQDGTKSQYQVNDGEEDDEGGDDDMHVMNLE